MTVNRAIATDLAAVRHRSVWLESESVPDTFDHVLLQLRKHPGMSLGVVPNVVGMPCTAADPLVGVESSIRKTVRSR